MKTSIRRLFLLFLFVPLTVGAQETGRKEGDRSSSDIPSLGKAAGVRDRAGGTHNKSNIGLFFENRGKLYPRRLSDGPSGEYPIGSGRHYIYRINPWIGVPGNVVQGRFTTNEEWEAVGGYHNPDLAQIAFSDRPHTWPKTGWPMKDAKGNPIIRSEQDSYCVYSDSNNTRGMLGLVVAQTGYTYSVKFARDMIFFKFDVINNGRRRLDSLYFAIYQDIDAGNVSGGTPEWAYQKVGINRELGIVYGYHNKGVSPEWPGGPTGYMGTAFLRTPTVNGGELGITDFHFYNYDDGSIDVDTVQYGIMSSSSGLFNSTLGPKFFHLGKNAPNLHFDDPDMQKPDGDDVDAVFSSGPYTLEVGDTLTFVTAIVAGVTLADLFANTRVAHSIVGLDFEVARPPETPKLSAIPGNRRVTLYWDNRSELSRDKFTNQYDFEGYRLYKSIDKGATWDQVDRNFNPTAGPDPIPLIEFDKVNGIGKDVGIQYSFVDTNVVNGFQYWYSLTAYDRGDASVESLESPRGSTLESPNIAAAIPRQDAIGLTPPTVSAVAQSGSGNSDYRFQITASDQPAAYGKNFTIEFAPVANIERGNLSTVVNVAIADLAATKVRDYAIRFASTTSFDVLDAQTRALLLANQAYVSGRAYSFEGLAVTMTDVPGVPSDFLPEAGDSMVIRRGIRVTSGGEPVLPLRRLDFGKPFATTNGILLTILPSTHIKSVTRTSGSGLTVTASVLNEGAVIAETYRLSVRSVVGSGSATSINVEVRNAANSIIVTRDSVRSGGQVDFQGVRVTVNFSTSAPPAVNTTYEVVTTIPQPITYRDKFTFSTTSPVVERDGIVQSLDRIRVVPNPYIVSSRYEEEFGQLRREPLRQLKFINLPPVCKIQIFTLDGDLLETIEHNDGSGTETWNMRTAAGREITSGIYLYLVQGDGFEKLNRFAVIK